MRKNNQNLKIKELEERIKSLTSSLYQEERRQERTENDLKISNMENKMLKNKYEGSVSKESIEVQHLLEIIRWQMNRETAAYPFSKEKGQITDQNNQFNNRTY